MKDGDPPPPSSEGLNSDYKGECLPVQPWNRCILPRTPSTRRTKPESTTTPTREEIPTTQTNEENSSFNGVQFDPTTTANTVPVCRIHK